MHDLKVLRKCEKTTYHGEDVCDGYDGYYYIRNHLGFRYVLRGSGVTFDTFRDITANLAVAIENVGFSNSYVNFPATLTLYHANGSREYTYLPKTDTRTLQSGETTTLAIPLDIRNLDKATYDIYLKFSDPLTGEQILFAHTSEPTDRGYKLGTLTVKD
jgi:hypothetical protein